jgi:hypothetical protein
MFFKPAASLQKGTFFGILLLRNLDIATNCKPMLYTAVEVNLVWQLDIFQNDFSLMAFLGREDLVGFYGWLVSVSMSRSSRSTNFHVTLHQAQIWNGTSFTYQQH